MGSHRDQDHADPAELLAALKEDNKEVESELIDTLEAKAREMTKNRENVITAGAPGEPVLVAVEYKSPILGSVGLTRLPDDPLGLRVSIGEAYNLPNSAYCTFRGDPERVVRLLEAALDVLKMHVISRTKQRAERE